jgi:hypothetical protein
MINFLAKEKLYVKKVTRFKYKTLNYNQQKYSTLPAKLKTKINFEYDIPKYMEVDMFSFSIFILYEPYLINDLTTEQHFLNRSAILNLYN